MDTITDDKLIINAKAELQRDISPRKLLAARRSAIYPIFYNGGLKSVLTIGTNGTFNDVKEDGSQEYGMNLMGPNPGKKCFFFAESSEFKNLSHFFVVKEDGIQHPNGGMVVAPPQIKRGLKETDCVKRVANGGEHDSVPALQMMDGCKSYIWRNNREGGAWTEDCSIFSSINYPIRDYEVSYALGLNLSNFDQFGYLLSGNNILCMIAKDTGSDYTAHYTVAHGDYSRVAWCHVNQNVSKEYARNNYLYGIKNGTVEFFETTRFDSYDYPCEFRDTPIYIPKGQQAPAVDIKTTLIGTTPIVFVLDMKDQVWYIKPTKEVKEEQRSWVDSNFRPGQKQRGSLTRSVPGWDAPVLIASGIFDITLSYEFPSFSPVLYCTNKNAKDISYMHAWTLHPEVKFTTSHTRLPEVDVKNQPNLTAHEDEVYSTIITATKHEDGEEVILSEIPFTIYSQVPQMLSVNGRNIVVNSLVSYSSYTDRNGCVMVSSPCYQELGCPSFGFFLEGMKQDSIIEIMPGGDVEQTLENIKTDDLKNATLNSSHNGPKRRLLEGKNISDEKLAEAVEKIHNIMKKDSDTEKQVHESGEYLVDEKPNRIMRTRPFQEMVPQNKYPERRWAPDGTRQDELSDNFLLDWLDRVGKWAQDLYEKPEVKVIAGGIATVLPFGGLAIALRGLYSVGRYLVNAVVNVFETVLNLNWKEIFEWLGNLLNFDNVVVHKQKLMELANKSCDNLVKIVDDYTLPLLSIQQLASVKAREWIEKIFADIKEKFGLQNKPREKNGYLSKYSKIFMEILGFIPGLIMKLMKQLMDALNDAGLLPSLSWDSSAFMAKVNGLLAAAGISVADEFLQLLEDAVGIIWDFFTNNSTAKNSLGEAIDWIKQFLLAVVNTIDQAINLVVQITRLVVSQIKEFLNAKIYIPGISQVYKWICGDTADFTLLEVYCFIAAIPVTVLTNISKFPGLDKSITFDITKVNIPDYTPPGKDFKDAIDSTMTFLGGDPYYAGGQIKKFIRLRITGIRDRDVDMVQLSSVRFFQDDVEVVPISVTNPGGRNPENENLLDTSSNKWLQFDWKSKNEAILIFEFSSEVNINRYEFQTANDEECRDPISWELHRSSSRYFLPVNSEPLESRSGVLISKDRNKINSFSITNAPISDTFEPEVLAKAPSLKSARGLQETTTAPILSDDDKKEWQDLIEARDAAKPYSDFMFTLIPMCREIIWGVSDFYEGDTQQRIGLVDMFANFLNLIDCNNKWGVYITKYPKTKEDRVRNFIGYFTNLLNALDIVVNFIIDTRRIIFNCRDYQPVDPNQVPRDYPYLKLWTDIFSPLRFAISGYLWIENCPVNSHKSCVGHELMAGGLGILRPVLIKCKFHVLRSILLIVNCATGVLQAVPRIAYEESCISVLRDFEDRKGLTENIKEAKGVGTAYNPNKQ